MRAVRVEDPSRILFIPKEDEIAPEAAQRFDGTGC
jgi:hypothetical protein